MLVELLNPIVHQAQSVGYAETLLPEPLNCYSVKATVEPGCAMFDISDQQGFIYSFNAAVWNQSQHERCWGLMESLYLKLVRDLGAVQTACVPQSPVMLPWLATLKLTPPGVNLFWLAELEECFALQLIKVDQESALPNRKPKDFRGFRLRT